MHDNNLLGCSSHPDSPTIGRGKCRTKMQGAWQETCAPGESRSTSLHATQARRISGLFSSLGKKCGIRHWNSFVDPNRRAFLEQVRPFPAFVPILACDCKVQAQGLQQADNSSQHEQGFRREIRTLAGFETRVQPGGIIIDQIRFCILLGSVAFLIWFSLQLGAMRIYQAEECSNISVARLLATGETSPGVDLFHVLLSWVLPDSTRSADLYASARLVMLVIFWANWILIALATGKRLFSHRWLVALVGAATLPLFGIMGSKPGLTICCSPDYCWRGVQCGFVR